jgi:hypothetical protein
MKTRGWLLLFLLSSVIGAGGVLAFREVAVLQVINTDRPGELNLRTQKATPFSLSYTHSIYLQPAAEEFEVGEGEEIVLRGVRTQSAAVAAYYGFEDGRDYYPVNRRMKSFALRLGMSEPQMIHYQSQKISLGKLGEKGDRLEIRVARMSW